MTTQRLLPGLKRTGPDRWRWGCWEITKQQGAFGRYSWLAADVVSDPGSCPYFEYERAFIAWDAPFDVRELLCKVAAKGPDPLPAPEAQS
jgi:hypothetical protein